MRDLTIYLNESVRNIFESYNQAPIDASACKQYFDNHITKNKQDLPQDFFDFVFDIWQSSFDGNGGLIPFRCDARSAKLARAYQVHEDAIIKYCKSIGLTAAHFSSSAGEGIQVGDVKIVYGDGSLGKGRAAAGLEYEDTIVNELINFVRDIAGAHKNKNGIVSDNILKNTLPAELYHWFDFYKQGALNELLAIYIKDPDNVDLTKYIKKTGGGDTRRNSQGQLFDKDFNISTSDLLTVLKDSGRIIADVTIEGPGIKNPQYISVKMKASQLSGVNYNYAIRVNQTFQEAVKSHESYDEVKDDKQMVPFNTFCETLGLEPEDVFNKYREIHGSGGLKDGSLKISKTYDKKLLGCFIQKLIGGNYWYTKPAYSIFVEPKDAKLEFDVDSARVTETGQGIIVIGKVNGLDCSINFRTDGKGVWPYRIFPKISVPDLIQKISK